MFGFAASATEGPAIRSYDVVIVGAGFAGMYMLHTLRERGFRTKVLEAASDVGGTWYWNRYPGARCDVESLSYSYSFCEDWQQDWHWPHRYAYQPCILRYAQAFAERHDLRRDIRFDTRVDSAVFDEETNQWTLACDDGARFAARFCVMATGCLSVPKAPDIAGIGDFQGRLYHTANWPRDEVDFSGQRVGVIGTGSSGIQCIPIIARRARHLTVFQRTPNFSVPSWNQALPAQEEEAVKSHYADFRDKARRSLSGDFPDENVMTLSSVTPEQRERQLERSWRQGGFNLQYAFTDLLSDPVANEVAAEFVRNKIRQTVRDPAVAETLCPKSHPIATKRLCVDDDDFETYNRAKLTLVDLRKTPIDRITAGGLRTGDTDYPLDSLVLATGFDAMTGALTKIDPRGSNGLSLRDKWAADARSYLGLAVAGFPNLFTVTGPGSPSVLCNMVLAIEQHVEWIGACLCHLRAEGVRQIEAREEAEDGWVAQVNEDAARTLYPRADSWYVGANVPDKARVFLPYVSGFRTYSEICDRVAANDYEGFQLVT